MFLVQCGLQGNSLMSVCDRLWSEKRSAFVFIHPRSRQKLTEWLIETQLIADVGPEGREVKHDGPPAPVGPIRGVGSHLSEEVVVRLAELDVDTEGKTFVSVIE